MVTRHSEHPMHDDAICPSAGGGHTRRQAGLLHRQCCSSPASLAEIR